MWNALEQSLTWQVTIKYYLLLYVVAKLDNCGLEKMLQVSSFVSSLFLSLFVFLNKPFAFGIVSAL